MKKIIPVLDLAGKEIGLNSLYAEKKVVLSFSCTIHQVSDLQKISPKVKELNSKIIIIGSGTPKQAQKFIKNYEPEPFFELYVDPTLQAFKEFELKRGLWKTIGFKAIIDTIKLNKKENVKLNTQIEGDPLQQGGIFVIGPGEQIHYKYINENTGDHADLNQVLEALQKN